LIGWQTLLADLSLILFMVTAAALSARSGSASSGSASSRREVKAAPALPKMPCAPALGEPLALWRAGGSQTLGHWLATEQPDGRQQLTITAHYRKGAEASALAAAQALISEAGAMGKAARVIIAPATDAAGGETMVSLAYDQTLGTREAETARGLLNETGHPSARTPP
jgi:hypothetical protein